ncbi:MAG: glycosyl hydrolase [Planctomycetes bacterium]|nr:glycosyl hydrolase [Planctomycetota bacterium]
MLTRERAEEVLRTLAAVPPDEVAGAEGLAPFLKARYAAEGALVEDDAGCEENLLGVTRAASSRFRLPVAYLAAWCLLGIVRPETALSQQGTATTDDDTKPVHLFSYFTQDGEDGLHLAYSHDGVVWKELNDGKPFLAPTWEGKTDQHRQSKMIRDPCIMQGPEGVFHLVWTSSWWDREFGYASSRDLIQWSEPRRIPVMENEPAAKNCWTPALAYDREAGHFLVFWASTVPGRHSPVPTSNREHGLNHRIYFRTTRDFVTFGETRLFFNPDFSVINAHILREKRGDKFYMFVKNENSKPPEKNIRVTCSDRIGGPYDAKVSPPITGEYWAEGPTALEIGRHVYVYFEKYIKRRMGAVRSENMVNWEDVSDQVSFPRGTRMGTAFTVSRAVFEKLHRLGRNPD